MKNGHDVKNGNGTQTLKTFMLFISILGFIAMVATFTTRFWIKDVSAELQMDVKALNEKVDSHIQNGHLHPSAPELEARHEEVQRRLSSIEHKIDWLIQTRADDIRRQPVKD